MGNNVPPEGPLFRSETGVTLVGGGESGLEDLARALTVAPALVAADGGADAALAAGRVPDAVYGDMDSLSKIAAATIPPARLHRILEQNSTDFDKALRHIEAPFVVAVGFTGARIDHELAALHVLVARPRPACVVLSGEDVIFHAAGPVRLQLPVGTRVSLFPFSRVQGRSEGLRWPIDHLIFDPVSKIGTSNEAIASEVKLAFNELGMLVILPRSALSAVLDALQAPTK